MAIRGNDNVIPLLESQLDENSTPDDVFDALYLLRVLGTPRAHRLARELYERRGAIGRVARELPHGSPDTFKVRFWSKHFEMGIARAVPVRPTLPVPRTKATGDSLTPK